MRLGRIIRLLGDHAMVVVSGTKIAGEIGSSRSEVWRLVQQLRSLGVDIAGHPASGYRLQRVPDLLLPEIVAPLLQGTLFADRIHHYFKVGSTNTVAMEAANRGAPEGSVFLAEEQTAGRGRGAHSWHSARSAGIYCSVLLRPALPPSEALLISLAAGLAVRWAVEEVTGLVPAAAGVLPAAPVQPDLRWPNDLLLAGKKFAGILTEMTAEPTRLRHLVVGVGINVNHAGFPAELQEEATSLRLVTGRDWSRVELAAALLKSLHREYRRLLLPQGRESILRRFEEQSSYARGLAVHVEENGGYEGITEGLDPRGFLQVRTLNGVRTVLSGTVRPR